MVKLNWARAAAWRARRHYLEKRVPAQSMLAVTSRICGLHAQVMSCAELQLWARLESLERGAVTRAVWEERTLIKTWAMRGTLHLLPASELHEWYGALGTSRRYRSAVGWKRWLGITLDELDGFTEAIGTALDGRVMTREELVKEVGRLIGWTTLSAKAVLSGWGTIFKPAAFAGKLCFGPSVGPRVTFTSPKAWLAKGNRVVSDPEVATAALTRKFLGAYGPATVRDFARWWGGASMATVRRWIAGLGNEVTEVELDGMPEGLMLAADAREARETSPGRWVRLLPGFDPYVIGASRHAAHFLPGDLRARVYRPQGWISPVLLVNGRMEGTWRHEVKGSRVEVTVDPFGKVAPWVRRGAEEEAERLAGFLGCGVEVEWRGAKV